MRPDTSPMRVKAAWALAVGIDALQVLLLPATAPGVASPLEWILDLTAMGVFWALLGWSWTFLPSFMIELVPFVDIAPTWTLAVLIATRGGRGVVPSPGGAPAEPGEKPPPKVVEAVVIEPEIVDPPAGGSPTH